MSSSAYDRLIAAIVREGKEPTRSLPSKFYGRRGDPANHIEFESEVQRQQAVKKQKRKRAR